MLELADPRYRGELAFAAGETDFQPIVTSVLRTYGQRRGLDLAGRHQGERRQPHLPRQRDDLGRGQPGRRRLRRRQPVLLVPDARRDRRRQHPLADRLLRPARPRLCHRRLRRGDLEVVAGTRRPRRGSWPSSSRGQGQEIIAHSISFEYPIASGVKTAQPETPFDELEPNPIDVAELGTGRRRSRCCARCSSCDGRVAGRRSGPRPVTP